MFTPVECNVLHCHHHHQRQSYFQLNNLASVHISCLGGDLHLKIAQEFDPIYIFHLPGGDLTKGQVPQTHFYSRLDLCKGLADAFSLGGPTKEAQSPLHPLTD